MEMYSPQKLYGRSGVTHRGELELRLRQAFKPHSAPVTAIAYERNGEIMATGVGTECVYVCVCVCGVGGSVEYLLGCVREMYL